MVADLLLERTADRVEIDPRRERVRVVRAKRLAETPDGIVRRGRIKQEQRAQDNNNELHVAPRAIWRFRIRHA